MTMAPEAGVRPLSRAALTGKRLSERHPSPPGGTRGIADRVVRVRGATYPPSVVVLWGDAGVLACGSGYTPVTVGDGGRHAVASHGAEVVARFEGA